MSGSDRVETRRISKEEMPVPRIFWPFVLGFATASGIGFFYMARGAKPEEKANLAMASSLFSLISIGFAVYFILRRREVQGAWTVRLGEKEGFIRALLLPCSRVLQFVILSGSMIGSLTLTVMAISGAEYDEAKVIIGAAIYWILFLLSLKATVSGRPGLLLAPGGIFWRGLFGTRCFVPWPVVAQVGLFLKTRITDPSPAVAFFQRRSHRPPQLNFGIKVTDLALVKAGSLARNSLKSSGLDFGWHLRIGVEAAAVPLCLLSEVVRFYLENPDSCHELGSSSAIERVRKMASQLDEATVIAVECKQEALTTENDAA